MTRDALDDAGYRRRSASVGCDNDDRDELVRLRHELAAAQRAAGAERRRADDLDRRLGHALLECGRLREALAAAIGEQQALETDLDAVSARWLVNAITGGATLRREADASTT